MKREGQIILRIIELEYQINMLKEGLQKIDMIDELLTGQDKMTGILTNLDQEVTFISHKIRRIEAHIKKLKNKINSLVPMLEP